MRLLLDTQCWLWMSLSPGRFTPRGLATVSAPENDLLLSVVSAWEIVIKVDLGKLELPCAVGEYLPTRLAATRSALLSVELDHLIALAGLPVHHRDPFDRMLVAQARSERIPIMSSDSRLGAYDVDVLPP
jgi:PIN domain nuclease of toxin-antitoxin system